MAEDPDLIPPDPDGRIREAALMAAFATLVLAIPTSGVVGMRNGMLESELALEEGEWPWPDLPRDQAMARRVHREILRLCDLAMVMKRRESPDGGAPA